MKEIRLLGQMENYDSHYSKQNAPAKDANFQLFVSVCWPQPEFDKIDAKMAARRYSPPLGPWRAAMGWRREGRLTSSAWDFRRPGGVGTSMPSQIS
jgi:hypothetical protein